MKLSNAVWCFRTLLFWYLTGILFACDHGEERPPDVSHIQISFDVTRWDKEIFQLKEKADIGRFLQQNPLFAGEVLHTDQYPHDSLAVNYLYNFLTNPGSRVLQEEIESVFGDLKDLQQEFEEAFKYLRFYYPEAPMPKIYTVITGFAGTDLLVSDSAVVIGLEYYLGDSASYRPLEFPEYILKRYQPHNIVPSVFLLLSGKYNQTPYEDQTMLAEMIYYGKAYYFTEKMIPNTPDSIIIGYTAEDMVNISDNQDLIWAHFVENQLLYESSHFVKKKYMDERPKTLEIGNKCPGRIGEWLGWEIVARYMDENPQENLENLMANQNVQEIFRQSKYKPVTH